MWMCVYILEDSVEDNLTEKLGHFATVFSVFSVLVLANGVKMSLRSFGDSQNLNSSGKEHFFR